MRSRIGPMRGFELFKSAAITIAGMELLRRIHKGRSTSVGCVFGIDVRPQSGMQFWQPNRAAPPQTPQPRPSVDQAICTRTPSATSVTVFRRTETAP